MNVDTRIVNDDGVEYYEAKSEFISPDDCTPEQQASIENERNRLRKLVLEMDEDVAPKTQGSVSINVNVWMDLEEPDFDNIVEWLNQYCSKNIDRVGTRETACVSVDVTRESLERNGYDLNKVFWRKAPEITSKDIVEAVQERENNGQAMPRQTLRDKIKSYFEEKRRDRLGRKSARQASMMENDRWNHRR